jgi:hypothetical protein
MTKVTPGSIAYIATQVSCLILPHFPEAYLLHWQVRFSLSSSSVFSKTDTIMDSERFYHSVLELLGDIEEQEHVNDLLAWWNRYMLYLSCSFISVNMYAGRFFPILWHPSVRLPRTVLWEESGRGDWRLGPSMAVLRAKVARICSHAKASNPIHRGNS